MKKARHYETSESIIFYTNFIVNEEDSQVGLEKIIDDIPGISQLVHSKYELVFYIGILFPRGPVKELLYQRLQEMYDVDFRNELSSEDLENQTSSSNNLLSELLMYSNDLPEA